VILCATKCPTNCSTPHVKRSAPCHFPRSTTQNGRASAARQALLSEDAAPSGLLGPKLARNAERMRRKLAPSRTSSADATGQPSSKKARASRSKASDADRNRQERAPSPPSSADATGQALSKKARALACIRPFVHSFAASISASAPAQQLKCQPPAFDDSSREAATASGLAIREGFFRGPQHGASCAFAQGSLGSTLCLLRRSHRQHQKALFVRGPFIGRDSFGSRRCGNRIGTWKNNSLASFERPIYQGIPAPTSLSRVA
jgi:hypothetical protein